MANIKDNVAAKETKRRLIEAAGAVFAEHGYERATIKEITTRAGASIAAINYHFSDKAELYYQVLRHAHATASNAIDGLRDVTDDVPPPVRLRRFIGQFLADMLDPSLAKWKTTLLWHEMLQPTAATERLLAETFRERCQEFEGLILTLIARPLAHSQLRLIVESIIGQCLFHVHHQELHKLMFPNDPPASARVEELADHIAAFSLAAIAGLFPAERLTLRTKSSRATRS